MMKNITSYGLAAALLFCASCKVMHDEFDPKTPEELQKVMQERERLEKEAAVNRRLELIGKLVKDGEYDEAEELLIPLEDMEYCQENVSLLRKAIAIGRREPRQKVQDVHVEKGMLSEVSDAVNMPSTYGTTVVIDSTLSPLELPQGKMEDMINRKVTMHLENATVSMLVDFLNENGLNVIADDALANDEKTLTMKVTDVPLKEVFSYIARNMGIAFYVGENLVWITRSEETSGPKLETRIIQLRHGFIPAVPSGGGNAPGTTGGGAQTQAVQDTELEDVLGAFLADSPAGSSYQIFRTRNLLVIRNTRENIRFVENIIREFDKQPKQVVIEARFVTINQSDLKDVGVEIAQQDKHSYSDDERTTGTKAKEGDFLSTLGNITTDNGMGSLALSGVIGKRIFNATIRAIENKVSAMTLSVPRVTVTNNRSAQIRKGDRLFYFEEYDMETIDNGEQGSEERLVPSGSPTELPLGLTFDVNVNIGNDGKTIMLGLKPSIVEFLKWEDFLTSGDDDDDDSSSSEGLTPLRLPHTHEQSVATTVSVESGETVVLGGMLSNSKKRSVTKVPILGDIPLIGWLFRNTETTNEPTNLLIFVTAHVINDRGEYVQTVEPGEILPPEAQ